MTCCLAKSSTPTNAFVSSWSDTGPLCQLPKRQRAHAEPDYFILPAVAHDALDPLFPISVVVHYAIASPFADPQPYLSSVQLRLPYGRCCDVSVLSISSIVEPRKPELVVPLNLLRGRDQDCQNLWSAWSWKLAVLE